MYKNQRPFTQKIIASLNEDFLGQLEIKDSNIAVFANFPYISIDLQDLVFFGDKSSKSDTIYFVKDVYLGFSVMDLLLGKKQIRSIKLSQGKLDLEKDEEGKLNLLKYKGIYELSDSGKNDELNLDLSDIRLSSIEIGYNDITTRTSLTTFMDKAIAALKIKDDHIFVNLDSEFILNLLSENQPTFFSNKHIALDLDLDFDPNESSLSIQNSELILEEAQFSLTGTIDFDDDVNLDIQVSGEKPDFSLLAAFLPNETGKALKRYKNEGEVYFQGSVRGKTGSGHVPEISIEFGCDNAYFLNPSVGRKVEDLRFVGFYTNGPDRSLETSEFQLLNFNARPEQGIFKGKLIIRDFTNPYVNINLNTDLDLGFLGQFFEIEGLEGISGQVVVNMEFNELVDLEVPGVAGAENSIKSELMVNNLKFTLPDYHLPIENANAKASMVKGNLYLEKVSFQIGESDFYFSGNINDFPAILHGEDRPVKADLTSGSKKINLEELFQGDSTSLQEVVTDFEIKMSFESNGNELKNFVHLPKGEFFIEDFHAKLQNYPHAFHDFHADVLIGDNDLAVIDFTGEIDKSDFHFSGRLENYSKWFQEYPSGKSRFEFDLVSKHLAVHDLLTYAGENYIPKDYQNEEINNLFVKGSLEMVYKDKFQSADLWLNHLEGKFLLHPLKLEKFKGRLHYESDYFTLENFGGKLGISDFNIQLGYYLGDKSVGEIPRNHFVLQSERLDLDALMGFEDFEQDSNHAEAFNIFQIPFSEMDFSAQIGKLNYHTFWLDNITLKARTTADHYIYLDTLGLQAAEGKLKIKGYFNGSDPNEIYFHSTMLADKVDLDKLMFKFENFGQDYLINENLHGLVSGTIESKFLVYPDLTPILEKSEANMNLTVYEGRLVNFTPLQAMGDYFKDKNLNNVRFDTLSNTFELKEGVLNIPRMNINSSLGFIELSGKQSLDMNMDYFIRIPLGLVTQVGFRSLFGGKGKEEIDPDKEDAIVYRDENRRVRFVNVNMRGTPDDYTIGLGRDRGLK
ncbi:AsmA-like C-terminal region-containing protein [Shivajiella indica]|uniref:AsmA-like C-terminal region-containing protein n=1 Tax=Shivajiella indica TaxID=872115 RepID=A0ABW5B576_9BACT